MGKQMTIEDLIEKARQNNWPLNEKWVKENNQTPDELLKLMESSSRKFYAIRDDKLYG
jgi:hypothetical protein